MKSIEEKPIDFFEFIINQVNFKKEIEKQLSFFDGTGVTLIDGVAYTYMEQNEFGEYEECTATVESLMTPMLYREFQKSKNHLNKFCTHNSQEAVTNFLRIQFNIIQNIINQNYHFINQHKYFLLPLRGLVNYINEVLKYPETDDYVLNESSLKEVKIEIGNISFDTNQQDDNELISTIFSFMNNRNEKREQILNNDDFSLLIKYTKELVENESLPEIDRKLEPKITNGLILHSYWVLHKELYTTKRIRSYFYEFIKAVFVNFSENELSSIKSQFGSSSRVKSDKFLPQIILDTL